MPQDDVDESKLQQLENEHIAEWYINDTEKKIVVKFARDAIDKEALKAQISK